MRFLALIPARYASTRFPGKPLAPLGGKPIIQRVYERVRKAFDDVYVATDDTRIQACVRAFGGRAVMTAASHKSGTDRCAEALREVGGNFDAVVNVQGDEPFIAASQLAAICRCFDEPETQIATLAMPFPAGTTWETLSNPNTPKVELDARSHAICFSRSVIPYMRNVPQEEWCQAHTFYKHIGLYAYRTQVLEEITRLPQSPLEKAESLEQLRWLQAGYTITVGLTDTATIGIDTPDDLAKAEEFLKKTSDHSNPTHHLPS